VPLVGEMAAVSEWPAGFSFGIEVIPGSSVPNIHTIKATPRRARARMGMIGFIDQGGERQSFEWSAH